MRFTLFLLTFLLLGVPAAAAAEPLPVGGQTTDPGVPLGYIL